MKKFTVAAAIMMLLGTFASKAMATMTLPRVSAEMLLPLEKVGCTKADDICPKRYRYRPSRERCYACGKVCPGGGGCIVPSAHSCEDLYDSCERGDRAACRRLDRRCALKEP